MKLLKDHDDYPWELSQAEVKRIVTDDELCPTETKSCDYLLKHSRRQHRRAIKTHGAISKSELGKWMLYLDNENADDAWEKAKQLYSKGLLPGVRYMRVTCDVRSGFELSQNKKVIFFYSGPASDASAMLDVGETILEEMDHERQECDDGFDYFYFKDESKKMGRASFGEARSTYRLPLPE